MSVPHMLLSQRPDPKEKQVISLDQDVQVCGYFWWMMDEAPCHEPPLSFSSYLFIYLFLACLRACGIPSLGMHILFRHAL